MLRALVIEAGFDAVEIEILPRTGTSPSARHAAVGLVMGNPVAGFIADRDATKTAAIIDAVEAALVAAYGAGPLRIPVEAVLTTATVGC